MLLRTLRERPDLAHHVRQIHAPAVNPDKQSAQAIYNLTTDLAELIRTCPNTQSLNGMHPIHHSGELPNDILAALATSKELKEHMWLLEGSGRLPQPVPFILDYHKNWTKLETLVVKENSVVLSQGSMYSILRQLPALQHLALVGLSSLSFHDGTLQALSGLRSLRLEALEGLTDLGLEQVLPKTAGTLRSLVLIDLDVKSLRTVSNILSNFSKLKRFTFAQDTPPGLPLGGDMVLAVDRPLLQSPSLTYIHWELLIPGSANHALSKSIQAHGFPALTTIKVPSDTDGTFQSICRPLARKHFTQAEIKAYEREEAKDYSQDLAYAKTAAQLRIRGSRTTPAVNVVVQDEGDVQFTHVIGGYLGDVRSRISYELEPGFAGMSRALARVEDVVDCETFECNGGRRGRKRHVFKRRRELQGLF